VITALGLSPDEGEVYHALVTGGPAPLTQVQAGLGGRVSPEDVEAILADLVDRGLVTREPLGAQVRFRPTAPDLALAPLLAARRAELREAEADIARLGQLFREHQPASAGATLEVVRGPDDVRHRFLQVQLAAQHELLGMMPVLAPGAVVAAEDNPAEPEVMRRGVQVRVILDREWFDEGDTGGLVSDALDSGQELWVVDRGPLRLVVADQRDAMLSLTETGAAPVAAGIHEPVVVTAPVALSDDCLAARWQLPPAGDLAALHEPDDQAPDEVDRSILALLHIGLTDVNIARQLGIGPRSVQRRVGRLMQLAEARSRFQLGVHAVTAEWLPRPVEPRA